MVCFACFLPAIDFIAKENFSFTLVNLVSVESMHDASRAFNYFKSTIGLVRLKFGFCVFIFGKRLYKKQISPDREACRAVSTSNSFLK